MAFNHCELSIHNIVKKLNHHHWLIDFSFSIIKKLEIIIKKSHCWKRKTVASEDTKKYIFYLEYKYKGIQCFYILIMGFHLLYKYRYRSNFQYKYKEVQYLSILTRGSRLQYKYKCKSFSLYKYIFYFQYKYKRIQYFLILTTGSYLQYTLECGNIDMHVYEFSPLISIFKCQIWNGGI